MQKIKSGFTLVELLIVVVIIGILSAALLPRLTGHMARTRDLKRQTDLRNIAAAIAMYANEKGGLPENNMGSIRKLIGLEPYLSAIPQDPLASSTVKRLYDLCFTKGMHCELFEDGEYFQWKNVFRNEMVLVAKVELPEMANFVGTPQTLIGACSFSTNFGNSHLERDCRVDRFPICDRVKKEDGQTDDIPSQCRYTSVEQLYYIEKVSG